MLLSNMTYETSKCCNDIHSRLVNPSFPATYLHIRDLLRLYNKDAPVLLKTLAFFVLVSTQDLDQQFPLNRQSKQ